jgi:hypothetical protein
MNLSDIRTRLQDLYGNTIASEDDIYDRFVNLAYDKLCSMTSWWWLEGNTLITISTPMTAYGDTVFTNGASTITGTFDTFFDAGSKVFTGSRTYEVSANTGTTITFTESILEATTTATATIWKQEYALPTACEHIINILPTGNPNHLPLREVELTDIESYGPDLTDLASDFCDRFAVLPDDNNTTSTSLVVALFPPAQVKQSYYVRYRKRQTALSNDADIPELPLKYHHVLVDMAKLELLKNEGEDADRVGSYEMEVAKGLQSIMKEQRRRGNQLHRFERRGSTTKRVLPFTLKNTAGNAW